MVKVETMEVTNNFFIKTFITTNFSVDYKDIIFYDNALAKLHPKWPSVLVPQAVVDPYKP